MKTKTSFWWKHIQPNGSTFIKPYHCFTFERSEVLALQAFPNYRLEFIGTEKEVKQNSITTQ